MAFEALLEERPAAGAPWFECLHRSARQRLALFDVTDAVRLYDGERDGPGPGSESTRFTVDRYGDFAVVNAYGGEALTPSHPVVRAVQALGARGVYVKSRVRADLRRLERSELASPLPIVGEAHPEALWVFEHELRFRVRLGDGLSTGLFLDQRDNRQLVLSSVAGKSVLNLFAYTGSFSVAAGVGGAKRVTSVDLSSAVLERADQNLRLNDLATEQHRLLKADARKWLERAQKRGETFDWIVLDPPSFGSLGREHYDAGRDYASLVGACFALLPRGGTLLAVLNFQKVTSTEFQQLLREAARDRGRSIRHQEVLAAPPDFARSGPTAIKSARLVLD